MLIKTQKGLSLVELMIGLLVGAIVVAGAVKIFTGSAKNSTDNLKLSMLNQDLRVMMDIMVRDIRRAGYIFIPPTATNAAVFRNNPFTEIKIEAGGSCIIYLYDKESGTPGSVDNPERMGFKLNNGILQMRRTATAPACNTTNLSTKWESITSPEVKITELNFTLGKTELNVTKRQNPPYTIATGCSTAEQCLIIRNVTIRLSGALKGDASVTQTLTETVRVRNDQYLP